MNRPLTVAQVARALEQVVDPELGIDVVALGLVYGIAIERQAVQIELTLTSDGCPMGGLIVEAAELIVAEHLDAPDVRVALVRDPPWDVAMCSPQAREHLGLPPLS